jgi:hypothetical protein
VTASVEGAMDHSVTVKRLIPETGPKGLTPARPEFSGLKAAAPSVSQRRSHFPDVAGAEGLGGQVGGFLLAHGFL